MTDRFLIPGVILAGGRAQRMGGGDKPMRDLAGRPLLAHVIARLAPQCDGLILNAHGDAARFDGFGLPVIADAVEGFAGPLAGILAGLDWVAANRPAAPLMLSAAGDCPFLPHDLVARMMHARTENDAAVAAASGGQVHHAIALWSVGLRDALRRALVDEHCRAIHRFTARLPVAIAGWPDHPVDPFFNVNTPEDLAEAERLVSWF
jgi:molybdopterin-guanine dinucleotide biosynthesis protein A